MTHCYLSGMESDAKCFLENYSMDGFLWCWNYCRNWILWVRKSFQKRMFLFENLSSTLSLGPRCWLTDISFYIWGIFVDKAMTIPQRGYDPIALTPPPDLPNKPWSELFTRNVEFLESSQQGHVLTSDRLWQSILGAKRLSFLCESQVRSLGLQAHWRRSDVIGVRRWCWRGMDSRTGDVKKAGAGEEPLVAGSPPGEDELIAEEQHVPCFLRYSTLIARVFGICTIIGNNFFKSFSDIAKQMFHPSNMAGISLERQTLFPLTLCSTPSQCVSHNPPPASPRHHLPATHWMLETGIQLSNGRVSSLLLFPTFPQNSYFLALEGKISSYFL